jgi:tRNA wybutosine-synthesizing protein 1
MEGDEASLAAAAANLWSSWGALATGAVWAAVVAVALHRRFAHTSSPAPRLAPSDDKARTRTSTSTTTAAATTTTATTTTTLTVTSAGDTCDRPKQTESAPASPGSARVPAKVRIVYGSQIRSAAHFARILGARVSAALGKTECACSTSPSATSAGASTGCCGGALASAIADVSVLSADAYGDWEDLADEAQPPVYVFVLATYTGGQPPPSAAWLCTWLDEAVHDFRVGRSALSRIRYCVFGCGNSDYAENYNAVARRVDAHLATLGAHRIAALGLGDENVAGSKHGSMEADFEAWAEVAVPAIVATAIGAPVAVATLGAHDSDEAQAGSDGEESGEDGDPDDEAEYASTSSSDGESGAGSGAEVDLEDLAGRPRKEPGERRVRMRRRAADGTVAETTKAVRPARDMVTPMLRSALTKQGYRLIGSHSGVKLCRWTKSMLRGRGGCYKHTFYGIESHRCMETTPSLACANKCVFCWRHHTNPVGTEWRWKMDDAELIINGAMENHYDMIRTMKVGLATPPAVFPLTRSTGRPRSQGRPVRRSHADPSLCAVFGGRANHVPGNQSVLHHVA